MRCAVWVVIFSFSLTQVLSVVPELGEARQGRSAILQALAPTSRNAREGERLSKKEIRRHLKEVQGRLRRIIAKDGDVKAYSTDETLSDVDTAVSLLPEVTPYLEYLAAQRMFHQICATVAKYGLRKHSAPVFECLPSLKPYLNSREVQNAMLKIAQMIEYDDSERGPVLVLLQYLPSILPDLDSNSKVEFAKTIAKKMARHGDADAIKLYTKVFEPHIAHPWAQYALYFLIYYYIEAHGAASHLWMPRPFYEDRVPLHSVELQEEIAFVAEMLQKIQRDEILEPLIAMLPGLYSKSDVPQAQQAVRNILRAEAEIGDVSTFLREHGQTALRLFRINFNDGGDSPASWPAFCEGLLVRFDRSAAERVTLKPENWQSFDPEEHLLPTFENIYPWDDIFKGASVEQMLGRTLYIKTAEGQTLGVKFKHSAEFRDTLPREAMFVGELNARAEEWGLPPLSYQLYEGAPYPVFYLQGDSLPPEVKRLLEEAQRHPKARPLYYDGPPGHPLYTAFAYKVSSADPSAHWRYLSDPTLTKEEFVEASDRNLFILGTWARHGLIHPDVIELFHSLEQGRRYFSLVELLDITGGRDGAGRLNGWTQATDFPNPREAGIVDVAEVVSLDELILWNSDKYRRLIPDENLPVPYYLSNFLGDYLLSWALIAGRYWRERGEFDWKDTARVREQAAIIRGRFQRLYRTFTQKDWPTSFEEAISAAIDWERFARQMAYFMAKGDGYSDDLLARSIPVEIYGEGVRVIYSTTRDYPDTRGWKKRDAQGRQGWYLDGVHPDLGPVNGPLPLQELIKAIYLYSVGMVVARAGVFEKFPPEALAVESQL